MGLLVNGQWQDRWYETEENDGEFIRNDSQFRDWVTADGGAGPGGSAGFAAEPGRYHLYVSLACPWAHRTLIFRALKDLREVIGLTVVEPVMLENGWESGSTGRQTSPVPGLDYLYQLYLRADPDYSGRVTVPVLWDTREETIVNNESADIIRIFNSAFNDITGNQLDFYPPPLREEIDDINRSVYEHVNNGVYKAGFATTQHAYEKAFDRLFEELDRLEERLGRQRYLAGAAPTEADWRLFTTLVRFDAVYYGHFKTNRRRIEDYPNLSNYLRDLYQHPQVAATVDFGQIKTHYYVSHPQINPTQVIPKGPALDYHRPHDRQRFSTATGNG